MAEPKQQAAQAAMRRINEVWLHGEVEELATLVHPDVVMVFPGFAGRIQGKEEFLAGFRDFCDNAKIHEFHDHDYEIDVVGDMAVVTFRYRMIYERSGERYHSTGRDFWIFQNQGSTWIAIWRTMLDADETVAQPC